MQNIMLEVTIGLVVFSSSWIAIHSCNFFFDFVEKFNALMHTNRRINWQKKIFVNCEKSFEGLASVSCKVFGIASRLASFVFQKNNLFGGVVSLCSLFLSLFNMRKITIFFCSFFLVYFTNHASSPLSVIYLLSNFIPMWRWNGDFMCSEKVTFPTNTLEQVWIILISIQSIFFNPSY